MSFNTLDNHGGHITTSKPGNDSKLGFFAGIVGGIYQYYMNIHLDIDFWSKLLESAVTAGICGFVGVAGKEIFAVLKTSIVEYIRGRKAKKNE